MVQGRENRAAPEEPGGNNALCVRARFDVTILKATLLSRAPSHARSQNHSTLVLYWGRWGRGLWRLQREERMDSTSPGSSSDSNAVWGDDISTKRLKRITNGNGYS